MDRVTADAELIRKKFFQAGEMKSSSIASNLGRRLHLIRALAKLDAFVIAFCARKSLLNPNTGLAFKKSFIKYFANALYSRVARCAEDLEFVIDEHGTDQFQSELRAYLGKKVGNDLFSPPNFTFGSSRQNVLLQVADVFAGSLARIYDDGKIVANDRQLEELKSALRDRVSVTLWPAGREEGVLPATELVSEDDEAIRAYCVRQAKSYLAQASEAHDDRDELARAIFLDALLAHHTLSEAGSYVSTAALKREISLHLGESISDHRFRSAVVAKLRDAEVIISSCSKGYRIPSSVSDMREFVTFANSILTPMVARLGKASRGIREATLGSVEILAGDELSQLRGITESFRN